MFRGHRRESSAGRLAHPPHSMRGVEACSAAAARRADFVSPHCRPRITEVHSEASCAAAAQSLSAALIGYDGTVSTRQRLDMLNGGLQEQARKSRARSPSPAMP